MIQAKLKGVVVLASMSAALFTNPAESYAIFGWFGGCNTCYRPACSPCAPACSPCATTCARPCTTTCRYVPQTCYRRQTVCVPVTSYRPVTSCDPCTGCPTTCMKPCTTYVRRCQMVPYTTYRMVYSTSCAPCATGCSTGCATGCSSCGTSGAVAGAGCSSGCGLPKTYPTTPAPTITETPTLPPEVEVRPVPEARRPYRNQFSSTPSRNSYTAAPAPTWSTRPAPSYRSAPTYQPAQPNQQVQANRGSQPVATVQPAPVPASAPREDRGWVRPTPIPRVQPRTSEPEHAPLTTMRESRDSQIMPASHVTVAKPIAPAIVPAEVQAPAVKVDDSGWRSARPRS